MKIPVRLLTAAAAADKSLLNHLTRLQAEGGSSRSNRSMRPFHYRRCRRSLHFQQQAMHHHSYPRVLLTSCHLFRRPQIHHGMNRCHRVDVAAALALASSANPPMRFEIPDISRRAPGSCMIARSGKFDTTRRRSMECIGGNTGMLTLLWAWWM